MPAGCVAGRSRKTTLEADELRRAVGQHRAMPNATRARRVLAATVPLLIGVAALTGCGGASSDEVPSSGLSEASGAAGLQRQFVKVVDHVSPQVVQIETARGLGSGIVYNGQGDIVTNAHVTGNATQFRVTQSNGDVHSASLVGSDPGNDLAVIHLDGATPNPATFADSSDVRSGDIVFAIGNPLGLQSSVTQGIVSSINRSVSEGDGVTLSRAIQTSAEINPGNSGGALVDLTGRVVGIPTLAALDPEFGNDPAPGIGFAIGSDDVRRVADRLLASTS
jgi:putative serine protease PepD